MYINIWPVNSVNWTNITTNFIVSMTLQGVSIINTNTGFTTSYSGTALSANKVAQTNFSNLCNVSNIKPPIAGEIADYTFNFDLSKVSLKSLINELFIFFPNSLYNININGNESGVQCYYGQGYILQPVTCYTLEDN